MLLEVAGLSDVGMRRRGRVNEDSFTVMGPDEGRALLTVADGVGGAASGNRASALVVEAAREFRPGDDLPTALREIGTRANEAVRALQNSSSEHEGAGSTMVAAFIDGDTLWTANVGDSRVYRLREGRLEQLTEDHSYVQEEVRAGRLTREEARTHRRANIITRNIGGEERADVDIERSRLQHGDVVLLCSDGLNGPLTDDEIRDVVLRERGRPVATAQALIDTANAAGGPDNVTAVVARLGGEDISPIAAPSVVAEGRSITLPLVGVATALLVLLLFAAFVAPGFLSGGARDADAEPTAAASEGPGVLAGLSIPVERSDERGVIFSQFVGLPLDELGSGCGRSGGVCLTLDWKSTEDVLRLIEQMENEFGADLRDVSDEVQGFRARTRDAWDAAGKRAAIGSGGESLRALVILDLVEVDGAAMIQVAAADHWIFAEFPSMAPFLDGQTLRFEEIAAGSVELLIVPDELAERLAAVEGAAAFGLMISVPGLELPFVPLLRLEELGLALVDGLDGVTAGEQSEEPAARPTATAVETGTPTAPPASDESATPSATPDGSATPESNSPTDTATPEGSSTPAGGSG